MLFSNLIFEADEKINHADLEYAIINLLEEADTIMH